MWIMIVVVFKIIFLSYNNYVIFNIIIIQNPKYDPNPIQNPL
jgi:hypothetical protein